MVRMEFKMENMKSEVELCVKRVESIKMEVSDQMKTNQQEMEKGLEASMKEVSSVTAEVKTKLNEFKGHSDAVTLTVAFKARLNENVAVGSSGQVIVFPTVLFNEADAYNLGTGKFTAPVNGLYMFSLAFCVYPDRHLVVGIMIEGTRYTTSLFRGDDGYGCSSADTVAIVTAGQKVWVESIPGGNTGTIIYQDNYRWNTFSGALINTM